MKQLRRIFMVVIATTFISLASAQDIDFFTTNHDFGEVKEENGPITYSFQFVNKGTEEVTIREVEASCGCTTPDWSGEAVMPGDTGYVIAQYNPLNRPGKFNKSLTVSYNVGESAKTSSLYIEGNVQPKPKTVEDDLPTEMGQLRVKYRSLNMGKITDKEPVKEVFQVYNMSDSVVSWLPEKSQLPSYITVDFIPEAMEPESLGEISLTYDVKEKKDLGYVSDQITLYTTEEEASEKDFHVIATIEEYFPPMSNEELSEAPRLSFDRSQYDFGSVSEGSTVVGHFTLINRGRSDLEIRKAKTNCECVISKISKTVIPAGESATMEVSFNTTGRRGRQYKTITVFSNDPTAPTQMLTIKSEVNN